MTDMPASASLRSVTLIEQYEQPPMLMGSVWDQTSPTESDLAFLESAMEAIQDYIDTERGDT